MKIDALPKGTYYIDTDGSVGKIVEWLGYKGAVTYKVYNPKNTKEFINFYYNVPDLEIEEISEKEFLEIIGQG